MVKDDIILRIKELMIYFKYNQGQFAHAIDMDPSGFSKRLNGDVAIGKGVINKIVLALGVNKNWLLTGEGDWFYKGLGAPPEIIEIPFNSKLNNEIIIPYQQKNEMRLASDKFECANCRLLKSRIELLDELLTKRDIEIAKLNQEIGHLKSIHTDGKNGQALCV